ncbi:MAG: hypothetical protein R3D57_02735 [Hyphomicrobiaceae bacterium]
MRASTSDYAKSSAEDVGDMATRLAGQAAAQAERVVDNAEAVARRVADAGREAQHNVEKVAGNIRSAVDTSVKEQPMTTLAVAAVLGFVLGAIWKS